MQIYTPSALPGVRILAFRGSTRFHAYYNEVYSIAAVFCSGSEISFRGKKHVGKSEIVGLLEPDGILRQLTNPIPEFIVKLQIEPKVMADAAREMGAHGGSVRFGHIFAQSEGLLKALGELHNSVRRAPTPLELQSIFATCLRKIVDNRLGGLPEPKVHCEPGAVRKARDLLHDRFAEAITLDDLAQVACASPYYISRLFTRTLGVSPHAYQIHLRLAEARAQLARGVPLSIVANKVGFTDQSHLARHFRRTLGVTPGAYLINDGKKGRKPPEDDPRPIKRVVSE